MAIFDCVLSWSQGKISRVLLLVGLALCLHRVWRRWRGGKAMRGVAGKVVLITGASSGLGEALVRAFYSAGAKVILASRNTQQLQKIKFQLESMESAFKPSSPTLHPPKVMALDLCDANSIPAQAQTALRAFGRVDILVNNAGVSSRGSAVETELEVDRAVMEVNFFGPITLTKALLPAMLEQGSGQIVVISSLQGKIGLPLRSSYSASKHALQGYFDSLRTELGSRGIEVCVVSPGYIRTNLSLNSIRGDGSRHGVTDPSTANGMSAEQAAHYIVQATATKQRELIIAPPHHTLAVYLQVLCPTLLDQVLSRRTKH